MSKYPLILLILGFISPSLIAQDIHYTQYQMMPTAINPAFTGIIPGEATHRLTSNYRSQWTNLFERNTFQTLSLTYDRKICIAPTYYADEGLGIGVNFFLDEGGGLPLRRGQANLLLGYTRRLGTKLFGAAGVEVGGIFHQIGDDLLFDEEFEGGPGEDLEGDQSWMGDIGGGVLLYTEAEKASSTGGSIGASFKHINRPEYRFFSNDKDIESRLPRRLTLHGQYTQNLGGISAIRGRGLYMRQSAFEQILIGLDWVLAFGNSQRASQGWRIGGGVRRSRFLDTGFQNNAVLIETWWKKPRIQHRLFL